MKNGDIPATVSSVSSAGSRFSGLIFSGLVFSAGTALARGAGAV